MTVKQEFIIERQGKAFALYAGLLDAAHNEGLKRIETELLQFPSDANGNVTIARAVVETANGIYTGIGDTSPQNITPMVRVHAIRMAETRAKARALRDAINFAGAALEELGPDQDDHPQQAPQRQQPQQREAVNGTAASSSAGKGAIQQSDTTILDWFHKQIAGGDTALISIDNAEDMAAVLSEHTGSDDNALSVLRYLRGDQSIAFKDMTNAEMSTLLQIVHSKGSTERFGKLVAAANAVPF